LCIIFVVVNLFWGITSLTKCCVVCCGMEVILINVTEKTNLKSLLKIIWFSCISSLTMHSARWRWRRSASRLWPSGREVHTFRESTFCKVTSNVYGSPVWDLFHVSFLAPIILGSLLELWKICASLVLDVTPCTLVHRCLCFRTTNCLSH
jgi:hypothetical protein